jgi:hypothetical protein
MLGTVKKMYGSVGSVTVVMIFALNSRPKGKKMGVLL